MSLSPTEDEDRQRLVGMLALFVWGVVKDNYMIILKNVGIAALLTALACMIMIKMYFQDFAVFMIIILVPIAFSVVVGLLYLHGRAYSKKET